MFTIRSDLLKVIYHVLHITTFTNRYSLDWSAGGGFFGPSVPGVFFLSCRVLKNILNVGKKIIWSVLHILGVAVGVGGVPSRQWSEPPDDHESEEFYKTSWANLPQQSEECQVDNGPPDDHESEEFWEECQVDNDLNRLMIMSLRSSTKPAGPICLSNRRSAKSTMDRLMIMSLRSSGRSAKSTMIWTAWWSWVWGVLQNQLGQFASAMRAVPSRQWTTWWSWVCYSSLLGEKSPFWGRHVRTPCICLVQWSLLDVISQYSIPSMYGLFSYIYHISYGSVDVLAIKICINYKNNFCSISIWSQQMFHSLLFCLVACFFSRISVAPQAPNLPSDGPWWCMILGQCYVADPNNVYALDTRLWVCLQDLKSIKPRWWFQRFFIFTPTWKNDPIWRIFFKWVSQLVKVSSRLEVGI